MTGPDPRWQGLRPGNYQWQDLPTRVDPDGFSYPLTFADYIADAGAWVYPDDDDPDVGARGEAEA